MNKPQEPTILRKVLIALFLALLCIVSFHKAVADDGQLSPISAIAPKGKTKLQMNCSQLQTQVTAFAQELLGDGQTLSGFSMQAARAYYSWLKVLTPLEDQKYAWPKDFFKPIEVSTKNIDQSGSEVFSWSDLYEQKLESFESAIKNCMPDTPARKNKLTALTNFEKELSDAQQAAGGFVSDINSQLSDWNHLWRALEGTTTRVPQGYFQSLVKGADELTEAGGLFQDNSQLLSEHFKAVFSSRWTSSLTQP